MRAILLAALLLLPASAQEAPGGRESITFLLGEDDDPRLPMFQLAGEHFLRDPSEHTDWVVSHLRSLREVRNYLARNAPGNRRPWGLINLVAHGRPGYLDVCVTPGGPKVTTVSLQALVREQTFPPLDDDTVDSQTEVHLHGCSVGRDPGLLKAFSMAFGGEDPERPLIRATRWHTSFRPQDQSHSMPSRYLCRNWDLVYRSDAKPDPATLTHRFQARNRGETLNVVDALSRDSARFHGDTFSYETPVHFTWTLAFPGKEVPSAPGGPFRARRWLLAQDAFQRTLQAEGLAYDDLAWVVSLSKVKLGDNEYPALVARGEGRALHILQGLCAKGTQPQIAWEDGQYYASGR